MVIYMYTLLCLKNPLLLSVSHLIKISPFQFLFHKEIMTETLSHTHTHFFIILFVYFQMISLCHDSLPTFKASDSHTVTQKQSQLLEKHTPNQLSHKKKPTNTSQPKTFTCRGNKVLLLLSVRNMFSSIQDLGPSDPPERGNLGGAMTLLEKGFFKGETWLTEPGTPMPLPLRWSLPQDIPPEPQPFPW